MDCEIDPDRARNLVRILKAASDEFATPLADNAGPNVHLIYPRYEREKVLAFIMDELLGYCHQEQWIDDRMGAGPEELSNNIW